jgi:hypothetical protein
MIALIGIATRGVASWLSHTSEKHHDYSRLLSHGHTAATAFLTVYFTYLDYRMSIITPQGNIWVNQEALVNCERVMRIYQNPPESQSSGELSSIGQIPD